MTNRNATSMTLSDFERLLVVFGADRTRWPLTARAGAVARLASDRDARRLLAEAEALEAVLVHVSQPGRSDVSALANRIVAASQRAPRSVVRPDNTAVVMPVRAKPSTGQVRHVWRDAMLLAASLTIGVFVGQSQLGTHAVPALEALTGISIPSSNDRLAVLDLQVEPVDED